MTRRRLWLLVCVLAGCPQCPRPNPPPLAGCIPERGAGPIPPGCVDDGDEPNGSLLLATAPPSGSACAMTTRNGTLAGDYDVDVFRSGACALSDAVDPSAQLTGDGLRLCLFVACQYGTTNLFGCYEQKRGDADVDGGAPPVWKTRTDSGFLGCCRNGSGRVAVQAECGGIAKQQLEGFVWVDPGDEPLAGSACPAYSVSWRMN